MEQQPHKPAVFQQADVPEDESLADNGAHHRHVHRIPYVTIKARHDQVAGRKDRCRPPPLSAVQTGPPELALYSLTRRADSPFHAEPATERERAGFDTALAE